MFVNFMITSSNVVNSRRRRETPKKISASDAQVYRDLAQASGGLAIEVTKSELPLATSIIQESTTSSLVMNSTVMLLLVHFVSSQLTRVPCGFSR